MLTFNQRSSRTVCRRCGNHFLVPKEAGYVLYVTKCLNGSCDMNFMHVRTFKRPWFFFPWVEVKPEFNRISFTGIDENGNEITEEAWLKGGTYPTGSRDEH